MDLMAHRSAGRRFREGTCRACVPGRSTRWLIGLVPLFLAASCLAPAVALAQPSMQRTVRKAQERVVKVYGAGGIASLEAYQSGFLVSPEGHVATVWSYVLDVEPIVVLDDGRRFEASIVGFEPRLELAILKIDGSELPFFRFEETIARQPGEPVLAVSNLFGIAAGNEPASVMRGSIAAVTDLDARRGTFQTAYSGPVYVLDLVANNPGAAGGALVDSGGQLVGMLGKELRDTSTGVWLNYALPADQLKTAIGDIVAGRQSSLPPENQPRLPRQEAHNTATLGLQLVPDVLEKTPAYIDAVASGSPAAKTGLQPDDLILLVDGVRIDGQASLRETLRTLDRRDPVSLTIQRGSNIIPMTVQPR